MGRGEEEEERFRRWLFEYCIVFMTKTMISVTFHFVNSNHFCGNGAVGGVGRGWGGLGGGGGGVGGSLRERTRVRQTD